MENIFKFLNRLQEAVGQGEESFSCPLCGAVVQWGRADGSGHVHACCSGCGIRVAE